MKILCISDKTDPLVYSPHIKKRFADIDYILCAGDLRISYIDFIVSSLNKPLFFVFGNHYTEELKHFKKLWNDPLVHEIKENEGCGAIYVGSKVKKEGEFIVAGLGGSMRYNHGENQFTDSQMFFEILKIAPKLFFNRIFYGRYLDVLLTHAPPKGIHDKNDKCHWGFKSFLWFMKTFKPKFLVHGHIHLYDLNDVRVTEYENTKVVNAYSHYVIDTELANNEANNYDYSLNKNQAVTKN